MAATERFPLDDLLEALGSGRRLIDLTGVDTELAAYVAVRLKAALDRPFVLITPDGADARRVAGDLAFFSGQGDDPEASSHVINLPVIEASPYSDLSPDRGAVMELLSQLAQMAWGTGNGFTIVPAHTLARRTVPKDLLLDLSYIIVRGEDLDRDACLRALADGGYHAVSTVEDPGTFAIRGGILDIYPPHLPQPVRVELWGDEVDSLRPFSPSTQRTRLVDGVPEADYDTLIVPPVREELLIEPYRSRARKGILQAAEVAELPTRKLKSVLDDLANGIPFMGIEGFRPAFYEKLGTLFDYLPEDPVFLLLDPMAIGEKLRWLRESHTAEYEASIEEPRAVMPPESHALSPAEVLAELSKRATVRAHTVQVVDELGAVEGPDDALRFEVPGNTDISHALSQATGDREPLRPLAEAVRLWTEGDDEGLGGGARVVIACRQQTQLDRLERLLKGYGVQVSRGEEAPRAYLRPPTSGKERGAVLVQGDVGGGFRLLTHGFALITDEEIFGRKAPKRRAARVETDNPFVQSFRELEEGEHVVHADHGVGRYLGLTKLQVGAHEADFLVLQFAGKDKLYLPVHKLGRVQKYVGPSGGNPRIDKLGGTAWQKVRAKAQKTAEEDAYALLDLYARREMARGFAHSAPDDYYRSFEATFPFQETVDQARAIDEVLADMQSERPMDRLLCGDVGFGKTEVAIRAAMKAVLDARQVALLVPTTVLALQHYKTLKARFAQYPIRVELLSRLVTAKTQREIIADIKLGKVDVVVGTHRVLSKDVKFKSIGLLILDEEHRFGVKDKERLKELRANLDVLSMTATPIPRTLQLSMSGIRDMSVITTPPADRLSVRTFVCRATDQVVRDAVLRELGRGGQVFFVHNRVHSIEARKAWLQSLVPEARIVVGHGQMDPGRLEEVMLDFTEGRYNVLLSTTIIESGIDISNANTMLVDHADHFGLAQLYQLRGRVGRGRERGYCYLLVPSEAALAGDARKRLAVIQKFTELGSGFQVASHDLELRGAGELLGTKQKGQIAAVGLDLYAQLLDEAVRKLRGEPPKLEIEPDLNLDVNARLTEDYIPDTHLRLVFYKRLSNCNDEEDVLSAADEMTDRFGPLPGPAENLVELMRISTLAKYLAITSVDRQGKGAVVFTFHAQTPLPVAEILALVSDPRSGFTAPADFKLHYQYTEEELRDTLGAVRNVLQRLAEKVPLPEEEEPEETRALVT
ncbi:MAG: transcription-repair coupling factor [Bradymonadia bacterium]